MASVKMCDKLQYQILRCLLWNEHIDLSLAIWNVKILFNFTTYFSQATSVLYLTLSSQNCVLSQAAPEAIGTCPHFPLYLHRMLVGAVIHFLSVFEQHIETRVLNSLQKPPPVIGIQKYPYVCKAMGRVGHKLE